MRRLRMIGGAVAALVLLALSVGVASPATAAGPLPLLAGDGCGGSASSVTACPANVLMLADAGIIAMPASGGAVGTVAAGTSGGGGFLDVLGVIGAAGFGLTQLFSPGGLFTGPAGLSSDGLRDQKITAINNPPGSAPTADYTPMIGSKAYTSLAGNAPFATVYAVTKYNNTFQAYCLSSTTNLSSYYNPYGYTAAGALIYSADPWRSTPVSLSGQGGVTCPTVAGAVSYSVQLAHDSDAAKTPITSWSIGGSTPKSSAVTPGQNYFAVHGTFEKHVWCKDPVGGGMIDYMTAQIASLQKGQSVNLQNQVCPAGQAAADASLSWTPDNGTKTTIVPPKGTAPANQSPAVAANVANPGCAAGGCLLELSKVNGDSCGSIGQLCPEWVKDPNYTQNYQCKFGGQLVSLDACSAYRSPDHGVLPNVTAGGTFLSPTAPVPTTFGTPAVDPVTGTAPAPGPSFEEGTDPQGCRPSSVWEVLNPFAMFTTMQCVIKDAFVPNQTKVQTAVQGVRNAWGNTPMGKVGTLVGSLTAALPSGSGCSGIAFTFPSVLGVPAQNFHVLDACSSPVDGIATTVRIIGAIGMIVGGILALTKIIGGVIALPGLGKSGGE